MSPKKKVSCAFFGIFFFLTCNSIFTTAGEPRVKEAFVVNRNEVQLQAFF